MSPPYANPQTFRHKHKRCLPLALSELRIESLLLNSYLENNITPMEEKRQWKKNAHMKSTGHIKVVLLPFLVYTSV
jgi:hypothetical protein